MVLNVLAWVDKRYKGVKKAYKYGNHSNRGRPGASYSDEVILGVYEEEGSKRLPYRIKSGKKRFVSVSYIGEGVKRVGK